MPQAPTNQEKKRNSQMILIIVGIIVAAAILFGGGAFLFTQLFSGHIKTPDEYQTMTLTPSSYTSTADCTGEIRAAKTSSVSPEVSGTVSKVLVDEGDKVKKGQVLFTVKNSSITKTYQKNRDAYVKANASEQQAYASYKSAVDSLQSAQDRKKAALKAAEKEQKKLEKQQEATTSDESQASSEESIQEDVQVTVDSSYDEAISNAQSSVDSAKSSYEAMKSNADNAKSSYESALEQQKLLTVKAGEAGTVINLKAEKGKSVANITAQGPALQIVDLNTLVGVVAVPEDNIASVSRGQEATITSDALPNKKISATVNKVANTPNDPGSSKGSSGGSGQATYNVTLTIGSAPKAKVGMKINASIELQEFGSVYYVPASAIRQQGNASYVEIVYNDNTTEQHQVTVVGSSDDGQQVIKGDTLAQGTTIRTDLSNS